MNDTFKKWLFSRSLRSVKAFAGIIIGLSSIVAASKTVLSSLSKLDLQITDGQLLYLNLGIQIIFIFVIICVLPRHTRVDIDQLTQRVSAIQDELSLGKSGDFPSTVRRAVLAEQQFNGYWLYVWVSLLLLYIVFFVSKFTGIDSNAYEKVFETFLNSCSAIFLYLCYRTLARPSLENRPGTTELKGFDVVPVFMSLLLISIAHLLMIVYADGNHDLAFIAEINKLFMAISGILCAITLGLMIGKLDSKLINAPIPLIMVLYLYPAIQPLYLLFLTPREEIVVLYSALLLKVLLFLFVFWTWQSKRLFYYFLEISQISEFIDKHWGSIKEHLIEPAD